MSGSSPNLVMAAECERQRRIAEWQEAVALGGQMSMAEQNRQSTSQQQAQSIQQAAAQALGALAVLSERSLYVLGESLMSMTAFVDPVVEPVVVAASKPVNWALARAMGCGSRQAIGFMVR